VIDNLDIRLAPVIRLEAISAFSPSNFKRKMENDSNLKILFVIFLVKSEQKVEWSII